jgi:hypothetical protein
MLDWADGLVRKGRRELREVPQKYVWAQTLWITRRGELYKRYYNVSTHTWHWGDEAEEQVEDASGKMGYRLTGRGWVSVEYVIASAWRKRKLGSNAPVERKGRRRALTARSLRWGEESDGEESEGEDEVWAPLHCRCGVVRVPEDSGYQISNRGRLKSPFTGLVTRGSAYLSCRYAACRNIGLINLTVAAGLQEAPQPPNYLSTALDCLMAGDDPEALAVYSKIKLSTAWTYFSLSAQHAVEQESVEQLAEVWEQNVSPDLVVVLRSLQDDGDPVFGGRIRDLMPVVLAQIPEDSDFHETDHQYGQLWFARTCLAATA